VIAVQGQDAPMYEDMKDNFIDKLFFSTTARSGRILKNFSLVKWAVGQRIELRLGSRKPNGPRGCFIDLQMT